MKKILYIVFVGLIFSISLTPQTTPAATPDPANLAKFEAEILAEINLYRSNPKDYAKYIEEYLKTFNGNIAKMADGNLIETSEGKAPVEEVLTILKTAEPLGELKLSDGLTKAAQEHSADLIKNNKTGHKGSDGSTPVIRVARFGVAPNGIFEEISYGSATPRDVVISWLVDDSTVDRNHRKDMLNPEVKFAGIGFGENEAVGKFCILVMAPAFTENKN